MASIYALIVAPFCRLHVSKRKFPVHPIGMMRRTHSPAHSRLLVEGKLSPDWRREGRP